MGLLPDKVSRTISETKVPMSTAISLGTHAFTAPARPILLRKAATTGRCPAWLVLMPERIARISSSKRPLLPPNDNVDSPLYLYYDTTMSKSQAEIEAEISRIKKSLSKLGRMHPGSLSRQKRVRGEEYWQLSYSHSGRGHTNYIRPGDVAQVRRELKTYRKFRELTSRWIALEIELAKLRRGGGSK